MDADHTLPESNRPMLLAAIDLVTENMPVTLDWFSAGTIDTDWDTATEDWFSVSTADTVPDISPSGASSMTAIMWDVTYVIHALISVVALVMNILTVIAMKRFPRLRKSPSSLMILNLAVMDIITSGCEVISFPIKHRAILGCKTSVTAAIACKTLKYPSVAGIFTSFIILMLIALDRVVAVGFPRKYKKLVTGRRSKILAGTMWIFWLVDPGVYYAYYSYVGVTLYGARAPEYYFVMPLWLSASTVALKSSACILVTFISYTYVVIKLRQRSVGPLKTGSHSSKPASSGTGTGKSDTHAQDSSAKSTSLGSGSGSASTSARVSSKGKVTSSSNIQKLSQRAVKIIVAIMTCTMLAWFPGIILQLLYLRLPVLHGSSVTAILGAIFSVFFYTLPAVNPLVYAWYSPDFRAAYRVLLGCGEGGGCWGCSHRGKVGPLEDGNPEKRKSNALNIPLQIKY